MLAALAVALLAIALATWLAATGPRQPARPRKASTPRRRLPRRRKV